MPELKNLFTSGLMNKDLDERLIPNGQYRDALNIQVSSSEGSDIGAIENILGNTLKNNSSYNKDSGIYTIYDEATNLLDSYGFLISDAKTIGTVKYDKTECIYWFVASSAINAIIEYDQKIDVVSPIIVDKNNVLKFSKNKLITGINIIDDLLFFTDNNSEPKCINIQRFKEASAATSNGFANHTEIYGRDFLEEDITVIKKSPLSAPLIEKRTSKRLGVGTGTTPITIQKKFTQLINGGPEYESIPQGTEIALSWNATPNYKVGDILTLYTEYSNFNNQLEIYEIIVQITSGSAQFSTANVLILAIPIDLPNENLNWEVLLKEEEPMFQYKFPRFAYRWKYEDGQYSNFSPFTQAAFIPDEFKYLSSDGHNLGMTNNLRYLKVYGLQQPPPDVIEIEVLYKETNSAIIYSVDTVSLENQELEIESELIYKAIESNQILRPWDNIPRKAKAQEIIANRLIYGNYLQNFNIEYNLKTEFYVDSVINPSIKTAKESIKTIRNYQLGVVWKDKYGRETPVFTSTESSLILGGIEADKINSLKAKVASPAPSFASHFKYFIKETANQYYNLALDRFYLAEDGNVWLSFPSSERNKIDEETYLYLKKQHNTDVYVGTTPKYKVLDIQNEAPDFIAESKKAIASSDATALATSNPGVDVTTFEFSGPSATNNIDFSTSFKAGNLIIIKLGSNQTKEYEILTGGPTGTDNEYRCSITEAIQETFTNNITENDIFEIIIKEKVIERKPEFEGRFFVKINRDIEFNTNVIEAFGSVEIKYGIIESADIPHIIANTGPGDGQQGFGWADNNARTYGNWRDDIRRPQAQSNWFGIGWSAYSGGESSPISKGRSTHPIIDDHLSRSKTKVRFIDANGNKSEVYTVEKAEVEWHRRGYNAINGSARRLNSNARKQVRCTLDRDFEAGFDIATGIEILEELVSDNNDVLSSNNPAIFETEPKENVELDIYYEASDAFPVSEIAEVKNLNWFNCYSFGNGVESDRIRDDFNAVRIEKGVKVSTVLDEPYQEERRTTGLIFSQIFNSISGINRLNQFIQALPITKDLNPIYGSIQKLHARDTDLITLCEDKCLKILAQKDALFNADGNANITSNTNVLGQSIPFIGEYGISKNPESFASYGFRAFFADKNRGTVLRLSRNGLDEISMQGMSNYFSNKMKTATEIIGSYDDYSNCYNLSFSNETVSYKQGLNGWSTRKSFIPNAAISLNNTYYTLKGSQIWSHDNETRNNFYNVQYKSSVKLIINQSPSKIKNYKTLFYEGDIGWVCSNIKTNLQDGIIPDFVEKESIYYNFIKGKLNTWDGLNQTGSLDTNEFSTQGIDILSSLTGDTLQTEFTLTILENND